jgi:hypothetical protein
MKVIEGIKAKITKDRVSFSRNGKTILVINRELLHSITSEADSDGGRDYEMEKFLEVYNNCKSQFYKRRVTTTIKKNHKDYRCMKEALDIIKRHGVQFKEYIDAQIAGLSFAGHFPKPSQLNTPNAEERLLDYLKSVDEHGTQEEIENDAKRYSVVVKKIKEHAATIGDAKFAARYEKKKHGDIKSITKAYLIHLSSE